MLSPTSRSRRIRSAALTGLVVAAASSGLAGTTATAQADTLYESGPVSNGPIAFITDDGLNTPQVWENVNPDGSGLTVVPTGVRPPTISADRYPQSIDRLSFSPDGTMAIYHSWGLCTYLSNADGVGARVLAADPGDDCRDAILGASPLTVVGWTPGNKLLVEDSQGTISTVNPDGSGKTVIGRSPGTGYTLDGVSATGALLFDTAGGLAILDPGSTTPRMLPVIQPEYPGAQPGHQAQFSPDGTQVAFLDTPPIPPGTGEGDAPFPQLFVVPTDGSTAPREITAPTKITVIDFAWSPDGTQLAYSTIGTISTVGVGGGTPTIVDDNLGGGEYFRVTSWHNGPIRPPRTTDRVDGPDRDSTAVAASQFTYANHGAGGRQATSAVISRDNQFADALGGSALAAEKDGPLLLTSTTGLNPGVGNELTRILAPGSTVYVLGGVDALSPTVARQITALGFTVHRIAGSDRFSTSVAIAKAISPNPHTLMVATGDNFPDALTAGAAAAQDPAGGVVVLSNNDVLPSETKAYLSAVNPAVTHVYGIGGQGVAALRGTFPTWGGRITPLAGADRFATAAAVASSTLFTVHGPVGYIGLATGLSWPDALSGGALIATQHGPLLLADGWSPTPASEQAVLQRLAPHLSGLVAFGGLNALEEGVQYSASDTALGPNRYFYYENRHGPNLPPAR